MKVSQIRVMYLRKSLLKICNCNWMSKKSARCKVQEVHIQALQQVNTSDRMDGGVLDGRGMGWECLHADNKDSGAITVVLFKRFIAAKGTMATKMCHLGKNELSVSATHVHRLPRHKYYFFFLTEKTDSQQSTLFGAIIPNCRTWSKRSKTIVPGIILNLCNLVHITIKESLEIFNII